MTAKTETKTDVAGQAGTSPGIRRFHVNVPEADLVDLRRRIKATRLPEKETVADFSQGVQLAFIQALARYWATEYDWRKVEAKLNSYPNFLTEIDGLDIHFMHVRSKHENALPLIVTHGWPGSPIEQLKIIDPLTNPTAHGGSASDAFHVVIPSMAGYGFSGKPTTPGWDPARMARAWVELMKRLGYSRFAAQGGDWGGFVTNLMAQQAPPELIGIHVNFSGAAPPDVAKALQSGGPPPAGLSAEEQRAYDQMAFLYQHVPTQLMMAAHPQTLYGLADSPVALAAWMIDHDVASYGHIVKLFVDGEPYGDLTRDDILDNITLSWLTNTGVSSARLYVEYKGAFFNDYNISVPAAVSVFPEEVYQAPRSWTERAYRNLIHFNELPKGGHFAAWEQPKLFVNELRVGFKSLRVVQRGAAACNRCRRQAGCSRFVQEVEAMTAKTGTEDCCRPTGRHQSDIRPFQVNFPEADLVDLRRRINATRWPEKETVADDTQGVQLATMQKLARYWATEYDWRKVEAKTERPTAFHHRDRWARHSFHSRSFEARECAAAHRHPRMARLDHRAAEDHRAADQSDGPWRERRGRFRPGDPVDAGLRLLGQADHDRLGPRTHCPGMGHPDGAPGIPALRRARRRLGCAHRRHDGCAGTAGTDWHSHQHGRCDSVRD